MDNDQEHVDDTVQACIFCDKTFHTKQQLVEHFRSHAEPDKNEKKTKTESKKNGNCNNQNGKEVIVKCDECSEEFNNVTKAISHKYKKHPYSKSSHFCPWCGKLFPLKHILNIHLETHSNNTSKAKRLHCEECDVYFYCDVALKYHNSSFHLNTFHYQSVLTPPPSKKIYVNGFGDVHSFYYCHLCGSEYVVKYNLQKHIKMIHENDTTKPDNIIKCTTCDALFYNLKAYDFHNTFHKETDLYVTSEKMRKQIVTRIDQDFDFRRVQTSHLSFERKMKMNPSLLEDQKKYAESITNSLKKPKTDVECNYDQIKNAVASIQDDLRIDVDINTSKMDTFNSTFEESLHVDSEVVSNENSLMIASKTTTIKSKPATKLKVVPKEILEKMKSKGLLTMMKTTNTIKNLKVVKIIKPSTTQNSESSLKSPNLKEDKRTNTRCLGFQNSLDIISKRKCKRNVRNFTKSKLQEKSFSELIKKYSVKQCSVTLKKLQDVSF